MSELRPIQMTECHSAPKTNRQVTQTWRRLACVLLSETSKPKKATFCVIPTTRPSGKGTTTEMIENQWLPGVSGEGGMGGRSTQDYQGSENTLCDIGMDAFHFTSHVTFQIHRMYTPKVNPMQTGPGVIVSR